VSDRTTLRGYSKTDIRQVKHLTACPFFIIEVVMGLSRRVAPLPFAVPVPVLLENTTLLLSASEILLEWS
jgi:hypothetical protein